MKVACGNVTLTSVQLGSWAGVQWWAGERNHTCKVQPFLGFSQNQTCQQEVPLSLPLRQQQLIHCSPRVLSYVTVVKRTLHGAESLGSDTPDVLGNCLLSPSLLTSWNFTFFLVFNREPSVYAVCEDSQIKIGDKWEFCCFLVLLIWHSLISSPWISVNISGLYLHVWQANASTSFLFNLKPNTEWN